MLEPAPATEPPFEASQLAVPARSPQRGGKSRSADAIDLVWISGIVQSQRIACVMPFVEWDTVRQDMNVGKRG